jgi:dihydroorotase
MHTKMTVAGPSTTNELNVGAPVGTRIELPRLADDFHHHFRDDPDLTSLVLRHATERFSRALVMPNLQPPVLTCSDAVWYRQRLMERMPGRNLIPLMTLYLTDHTSPDEIDKAHQLNQGILAAAAEGSSV